MSIATQAIKKIANLDMSGKLSMACVSLVIILVDQCQVPMCLNIVGNDVSFCDFALQIGSLSVRFQLFVKSVIEPHV